MITEQLMEHLEYLEFKWSTIRFSKDRPKYIEIVIPFFSRPKQKRRLKDFLRVYGLCGTTYKVKTKVFKLKLKDYKEFSAGMDFGAPSGSVGRITMARMGEEGTVEFKNVTGVEIKEGTAVYLDPDNPGSLKTPKAADL